MSDIRKNNRRQDISELFGTDDIPLDDEYFEEKIKEMGDSPQPSAVRKMKLKKPAEDPASLADGRVVIGNANDGKLDNIFRTDDTALNEEFFEEKLKELEDKQPAQKEPESEYERWLEESLKVNKGYGTKESYQGEITEEEDSYTGSTMDRHNRQMAETAEMIRRLRARDAADEARDQNIHNALFFATLASNHGNYSGDPNQFIGMVVTAVWYLLSSAAIMGLFYFLGVRGLDLMIPWGLGGVVGAIIRYNGKEGYSLSEAMEHGAVEIGLLAGLTLAWVISLFTNYGLLFAVFLCGIFATVGEYIKLKKLFGRSTRETLYKMIPFTIVTVIIVIGILASELFDSLAKVPQ